MFITRFPINRTRRATPRLLSSPYRLHAAVAGSFPGDTKPSATSSDGTAARILWRVDLELSGAAWLYIVSPTSPSLVGLDEQIGSPDGPPRWETRDYEPLLSRITAGQLWAFRLVANPTRDVRRDLTGAASSDIIGKRVSHLTVAQQAAWLIGNSASSSDNGPDDNASRAVRHGFTVTNDDATGQPRLIVADRHEWQCRRADGKTITIVTARYDGVLRVLDADLFRHTLTHGIGHAKAFGCGLLTIAPVAAGGETLP